MSKDLQLDSCVTLESPLQRRLRKDLRCSRKNPCQRHSCIECASAFAYKYWNHVAKLKGDSSNKKLSAIYFELKRANLLINDISPELVRQVRDDAAEIIQNSNLAAARWIGLVHVFPLARKSPGSCLIIGVVHIAALTRSEISSLKAGFRKSKVTQWAWIDDIDDYEINERRGIPGGWGCYSQQKWIDRLKTIQQSDQVIVALGASGSPSRSL